MPTTTSNDYMVMGFEGQFYVDGVLAESIRNPKYSYQYSDVDATLRKHKGVKAYAKGMLDISVSFTLPNIKPRQPDAVIILAALKDRRKTVKIKMLDEEGGEGIEGDFILLGGDKSEEDENVQEWEIEAKPAAAGNPVEWV